MRTVSRGMAASLTAARASAARSEQATKANATTRAVIAEIRRAGKTTLAAIAQELEARGVRTPAGRDRWAPAQVSRLLAAKRGRLAPHSERPLAPRHGRLRATYLFR